MADLGLVQFCYMTGNDLLADLRVSEEEEECWAARSHALGYISAVIDAHQVFHATEGFPAVFRFPEQRAGELNRLIADRLAEEPENLDANAAGLVLRILQREFPVQNSSDAAR